MSGAADGSSRVWLITGCTSGLGRASAQAVLEAGGRVVAAALQKADAADLAVRFPATCRAVALDVTSPPAIAAAVAVAEDAFGGADVLLNSAGFGFLGAVEESLPNEYRGMYEVNLFGLAEMIRAVLPGMRRRGWGHVLNISSVGGFSGSAAFAHYSASKFAVEGLSESLAAEVAPFGIRVTIIEPGAFRTGFRGGAMQRARELNPAYAESSGKARAYMDQHHGTQAGDPAKAARAMMAVVASKRPPMRLPLGTDAYERIRAKLRAVALDIQAWEQVGTATAFEGEVAVGRVKIER